MIKSILGVLAVVCTASLLTAQSVDNQQTVQLIPAPKDLFHEVDPKCVPRTLPPGLEMRTNSRPFRLPAPIGTRPKPAILYSRKPPFAPLSPHHHLIVPMLPKAPAILPQIVEVDPKVEVPGEGAPVPGMTTPGVQLPDQETIPTQRPPMPIGSSSQPLRGSVETETADTGVNSQGVRTRIDRLRELLDTRRRELAAQESVKPKEASEEQPGSVPVEKTEPAVETSEKPAQVAEETTPKEEATPVSTEPQLLMTSPINRLRLADNLFGAGDTKTALQAYSAIDLNELSEVDQAWVQFQLASCHRRLGEIPEAEKHYRIVASYQSAGTIADAARWWLDRLEAKKELRVALSRLTTIVDTLQKAETAP